ncbi:MAG: translation elongation factor Ts [Patescibacteria group bacterium]
MSVTIDQIKSLREVTGVSMQACKKALEESGGNEEKAIELLRKRGEAKAVDRAARSAGEGMVGVSHVGDITVLIKVNCETDFSARSDDFVAFASSAAQRIAENGGKPIDFSKEVVDLGAKIGEKIEIGEPVVLHGSPIGVYLHTDRKQAGVVHLSSGSEEIARDLAMHVVAMRPVTTEPSGVDGALIEKEREIWSEELKKQNTPEAMWENIMKGKEKKFREERALVTQAFVKNPDITVKQYLDQSAPGAVVSAFWRLSI